MLNLMQLLSGISAFPFFLKTLQTLPEKKRIAKIKNRNLLKIKHILAKTALVATLWLLVLPGVVTGQTTKKGKTGKLRETWYSLSANVPDSVRFEAGVGLSGVYSLSNYDSLFCIIKEMEAYGRKKGNKKWMGTALSKMGKYYYLIGKSDSSILAYQNALKYFDQDKEESVPLIYMNIGRTWKVLNNQDSAIFYLELALEKTKKIAVSADKEASICIKLGASYEVQSKYLEAIQYYDRAAKQGFGQIKYVAAFNAGMIFQKLGLPEEASAHFKEAIQFAQEAKDPASMVKGYALMLWVASDLSQAQSFLDKGLALADSLQLIRPSFSLFTSAGEYFLDSLQLDKAEYYIKRCLDLSIKNKDEKYRVKTLFLLARLNFTKGQYQQSLQRCLEVRSDFEKHRKGTDLIELYDLLSKNYETLGQPDRALYFLRLRNLEEAASGDKTALKEGVSSYLKYQALQEQKALQLAKENAEALAQASQARERLSYGFSGVVSLSLASGVFFFFVY